MHRATLQTPALILQGERTSFGRREEVDSYSLSQQIQLRWIPSGDHSFKPTHPQFWPERGGELDDSCGIQ